MIINPYIFSSAPPPLTYATIDPTKAHANFVLTNGNLTATLTTAGVWRHALATIGKSAGKWYWELKKNASSTDSSFMAGVSLAFINADHYLGKVNNNNDWGYYSADGKKSRNAVFTVYGASFVKGDVIGVALNMDAGEITFYKNGASQGVAFTGITGTVFPAFTTATPTAIVDCNFGATAFAHSVPSGYNAGVYS